MALRVRVNDGTASVSRMADAIQQEIERFLMLAIHVRCAPRSTSIGNDALMYHIVLNSARVTIDDCVKAFCDLAHHQTIPG